MKKNIAVIGAGYWGKNLIRTFHEIGCLKFVYDLDLNQMKDMQKKYDLPNADIEGILSDNEIEGIVVATTAKTHFELAKKTLLANKDVFIEKPICLNIDEAIELKELAKKQKKILMVGHLMNYNDHFIEIIKMSKEAKLGNLIKIKSTRKSFGKLRKNENVIWSFATHDISMVNRLVQGEYSNFRTLKTSLFNENVDSASIFYEKSNTKIEIYVDWASAIKCHRFEVYFEKGILVFEDSVIDQNQKLYRVDIDFNTETLSQKNNLKKTYIEVTASQPLLNECKHFLECITTRNNPITDTEESIEVLKALKYSDER